MIKVKSKRTLNFAKLNWSIEKGEEKELPEDKEAQEAILAHWAISEASGKAKTENKTDSKKGKVDARDEGDGKK